jgi:hypothetical protein
LSAIAFDGEIPVHAKVLEQITNIVKVTSVPFPLPARERAVVSEARRRVRGRIKFTSTHHAARYLPPASGLKALVALSRKGRGGSLGNFDDQRFVGGELYLA